VTTVAVVVGVMALVAQTGAFFYWGGQVRQMLREHERRISDSERRLSNLGG